MNMIVAVDRNWAIGYKNSLLNSIPEDMKYFRDTTMGKTVIMGRKTLESFPGKRPLKDRTNIVITHRKDYRAEGAVVVHSVEEAVQKASEWPSEDVYVIGGESIYRQMLGMCDTVRVTRMDYAYEADAWFPDLDKMPEWSLTYESGEKTYYDIIYTFRIYSRTAGERNG